MAQHMSASGAPFRMGLLALIRLLAINAAIVEIDRNHIHKLLDSEFDRDREATNND